LTKQFVQDKQKDKSYRRVQVPAKLKNSSRKAAEEADNNIRLSLAEYSLVFINSPRYKDNSSSKTNVKAVRNCTDRASV
jgi:hypothetical protein